MKKMSNIEMTESFIKNHRIKDEDLKQDLYLTAIEMRSSSYRALYSALNRTMNRWNMQNESQFLSVEELRERNIDLIKNASDLEQRLIHDDLVSLLKSSVDLMGEREKEIIDMRFNQKKTLTECSIKLGIPVEHVILREQKALHKLRLGVHSNRMCGLRPDDLVEDTSTVCVEDLD